MDIIKKYLTNGQYITAEYAKKSIFLHHTIGLSADSAIRWWNSTPDRVGTPYIIDLDGKVYETFDPKYWAYHLGVNGDDNFHEKSSINIELVSAGPLRFDNGEFRFYPLWPNKTRFTIINPDNVYTMDKPWRDFKYYHKYSDKQLASLKELLISIYQRFPTIGCEQDPFSFFEYNESVLTNHTPGIWSHSTVRKDKNDIYPDELLISVINDVTNWHKGLNKVTVPKKPKNNPDQIVKN